MRLPVYRHGIHGRPEAEAPYRGQSVGDGRDYRAIRHDRSLSVRASGLILALHWRQSRQKKNQQRRGNTRLYQTQCARHNRDLQVSKSLHPILLLRSEKRVSSSVLVLRMDSAKRSSGGVKASER
jgi:hypothetical protein